MEILKYPLISWCDVPSDVAALHFLEHTSAYPVVFFMKCH